MTWGWLNLGCAPLDLGAVHLGPCHFMYDGRPLVGFK